MKDEGKFLHVWMKYDKVLRLLLKKTDIENQTLQLYKHEFENRGHRSKSGYEFNLEMNNGRTVNLLKTPAIARDLAQILNNNTATKDWLKERNIKFSMGESLVLQLEKL
jgi:hypothetical protein